MGEAQLLILSPNKLFFDGNFVPPDELFSEPNFYFAAQLIYPKANFLFGANADCFTHNGNQDSLLQRWAVAQRFMGRFSGIARGS